MKQHKSGRNPNPDKYISIKEPGILILGLLLSVLSAAICMQIMGQFGTTPNTSLIGVALVMVVARLPLAAAQRFRDTQRQNYVLSIASSAGFTAANCGFVAIATMMVLGRSDLVVPVTIGALVGSVITVYTTGKIFDSKIFPVDGAWPMGKAVATTIEAGDEGGKKGWQLFQGMLVGGVAGALGIPAAGVGIAFIANAFTMAALGVGMVLRGYSAVLFNGFDIGTSNIAQGVMIGAGIVALAQITKAIVKGSKKVTDSQRHVVSDGAFIKAIGGFAGLFMGGAVLIGVLTSSFAYMTLMQSVMWIVIAGLMAVMVLILVGTASMHSGWAPTFAVVTICLTFGVMIGVPPLPLAVLVGYLGSVGPCFSDTGIGLKTGWLIRGQGKDPQHEAFGRKQQVWIKQIGVLIGIGVAIISAQVLIEGNIIPPMSFFYASTVYMTAEPTLLRELALWAIPGAILQLIFGTKSVGLMLAAGLLINNGLYGIVVLVSIGLRLIIGTKHMTIRGPGLIAGDGLFGFGANLFRAFF